MKCLICLTVLLAVSYVHSRPDSSEEQNQGEGQDVKDYQAEVLKLYENIGHEDTHDFVRKGFPFAEPSYYTKPEAAEKFVDAYTNGFLNKEGYFNLYSYKNRHDTYRLFDIFYFAKDFETFMKLAQWAKEELNPLQFVYAYTAAIYQRKDTQGVIPPPFFEVLPQYFTPANVITSAYKAMIGDVKFRKFEVNNTGYEWSWYREHTFRSTQRGDQYDTESRLSYFREDVGLNDWYSKFFLQVSPWLSDEKYPDVKWERRGEYMYTMLKWMLAKYNMERYSNGLPPVQPLNFWKPIKVGYNPQISNIYGRPFFPRPDSVTPAYSNSMGVEYLENMYQRYLGEIESHSMYNPLNQSMFSIEGIQGFETFANYFYGISQPEIRKYYRPFYYQALETVDASFRSSNDVAFTGSILANFMTELRDPIFYQTLAYMDQLFEAYNARKPAYTEQELEFPGVEVSSIEFSDLETYFEKYEYDISNGVPNKNENEKYKYLVSKFRMNHKPFTYKITIQSDKDTDATIKVFLAPKYDADYRNYGFSGFTKYGLGLETFHVSLKAGSNVIQRRSPGDVNFKETPRLKHINELLQRSQQKNLPFHFPDEYLRAFPDNLALPRGGNNGTVYQVMAFAFPKGSSSSGHSEDNEVIQEYDETKYLRYPFDRPISEYTLKVPNALFSEVSIHHVNKN